MKRAQLTTSARARGSPLTGVSPGSAWRGVIWAPPWSRRYATTSSWAALITSCSPAHRALARLIWRPSSRQAVVHHRLRVRFFSAVDLVNQLEAENTLNKSGQLARGVANTNTVILDELDYLPFS